MKIPANQFLLFLSLFVLSILVLFNLSLYPKVSETKEEEKPTAIPSPKTLSSKVNISNKTYSIAIYGDSMVETMGENLEYLKKALSVKYPNSKFKLYNYGIGGDNVEMGLNRLNSSFSRVSRNYPPIKEIKADIIIIGSFSYNPFEPHNRGKHKSQLSELTNQLRQTGAKTYILIEIAPLENGFGKGPGGVNWPKDFAKTHTQKIIDQLNDSVSVAIEMGVGLIDVYSKSKVRGSSFGNPAYVSSHDGIHPSVSGHGFTAKIIASTIKLP